jgi:flagellar protein FliO/FliZ
VNTVELIGRLLVSLAAVLGVMWLLARRMKKGGRGRDAGLIDVLGRQQLSRNSAVTVVRIGEQALVLGVTDAQVSVLGQTDLPTALAARDALKPAVKAAARQRRPAGEVRPARTRPARPAPAAATAPIAPAPAQRPVDHPAARPAARPTNRTAEPPAPRSPLAGSALSPQTWKQTIESLREMTTRSS